MGILQKLSDECVKKKKNPKCQRHDYRGAELHVDDKKLHIPVNSGTGVKNVVQSS